MHSNSTFIRIINYMLQPLTPCIIHNINEFKRHSVGLCFSPVQWRVICLLELSSYGCKGVYFPRRFAEIADAITRVNTADEVSRERRMRFVGIVCKLFVLYIIHSYILLYKIPYNTVFEFRTIREKLSQTHHTPVTCISKI